MIIPTPALVALAQTLMCLKPDVPPPEVSMCDATGNLNATWSPPNVRMVWDHDGDWVPRPTMSQLVDHLNTYYRRKIDRHVYLAQRHVDRLRAGDLENSTAAFWGAAGGDRTRFRLVEDPE